LPGNMYRNADLLHKEPLDDSYTIGNFLRLFEEAYPEEAQNPDSSVSKYLAAFHYSYDDNLDRFDNHRSNMVLASALWRIRKNIGQKKTDKLVAETVLDLNYYFDKRAEFLLTQEMTTSQRIEWFDVLYGLIQKDKELFNGKNFQLIVHEFTQAGYPVDTINLKRY